MENYPAVNIFCELWPFGTYDPDIRVCEFVYMQVKSCDIMYAFDRVFDLRDQWVLCRSMLFITTLYTSSCIPLHFLDIMESLYYDLLDMPKPPQRRKGLDPRHL